MIFDTKKEAAREAAELKKLYGLSRQWRTVLESSRIDNHGEWRIRFCHKDDIVIQAFAEDYFSAYLLYPGWHTNGTGKTPLEALKNAKRRLVTTYESIEQLLTRCESL